ncbi:MAG: PA2779 family protein [bacterium]|nr:PA2779 family protein [bacterium]
MLKFARKNVFTIGMAVYMILFFSTPGIAAMISSSLSSEKSMSAAERRVKLETVKKALENKMVQAKLKDYGLNDREINEKIKSMNDSQIQLLAQASEKVLAGGDGLSLIVTLLVIVLLVILIMRLI